MLYFFSEAGSKIYVSHIPMLWSSVLGEKGGVELFSSHLCTSVDVDPKGQAV